MPMMAIANMDLFDVTWNKMEYKLKFVLDNPNFKLPQIVRVVQGHMVDEDNSLASGQVLTLLGIKCIENLTGYDSYGKDIGIPLNCPNQVKLISLGETRKFASVNEIGISENPPKFVKNEAEVLTAVGVKYEANSTFEIVGNSFADDGETLCGVSCRVDKEEGGETFILPVNYQCAFEETLSREFDTKRYKLSELLDAFSLPFQVQFSSISDRNSEYGPQLGVVSLQKMVTENAIMATTIIDGIHLDILFSPDLPVTVQVADKYYFNNNNNNTNNNNDNLKRVDIKNETNAVFQVDFLSKSDPYSPAVNCKEIHDSPRSTGCDYRLLKSESKIFNQKTADLIAYEPVFTSKAHSEDSMGSEGSSPKMRPRCRSLELPNEQQVSENKMKLGFKNLRRSFKIFSKEKRGKKQDKNRNKDYERIYSREFSSGGSGSSIPDTISVMSASTCNEFREITQCIDKLTLENESLPNVNPRLSRISSKDSGICLNRRLTNGSHSGYTVRSPSSNLSENIFENISEYSVHYHSKCNSNAGRKITPSQPRAASFLWSADDDDLTSKGSSQNTNDKYTANRSYGNSNKSVIKTERSDLSVSPLTAYQEASIEAIRNLNEDGVCLILEELQLSDFKETFRTNQINGELLLDLDEDDLITEMKFTLFQAKKIAKYIKGWRPEPENVPPNEHSRRNSLNPRDWSLDDVIIHLNTINLPDLGQFCQSNQVNGDLLLDILDKETLACLRNDHHVKISCIDAKKLKNFVLKGWRPDHSPKSLFS